MTAPFLPDGSWADPLDRAERTLLKRKLARASRTLGLSKQYAAANEAADLHLDVTERAVALPRENRT